MSFLVYVLGSGRVMVLIVLSGALVGNQPSLDDYFWLLCTLCLDDDLCYRNNMLMMWGNLVIGLGEDDSLWCSLSCLVVLCFSGFPYHAGILWWLPLNKEAAYDLFWLHYRLPCCKKEPSICLRRVSHWYVVDVRMRLGISDFCMAQMT